MKSYKKFSLIRRAIFSALMISLLSMAGCALVTRGTQQSIRIEAVSPDGKAIDADCRPGAAAVVGAGPSPHSLMVRRSGDDLLVNCTARGQVVASGKVVSRADLVLVSLAVGGVMSATIDHLTGAAYAYPEWITLVAGQERTYDRRDSADGPWSGTLAKALGGGDLPAATATAAAAPATAAPAPNYYRANYKVTASQLVTPGARPTGRDTYNAEKLAATLSCSATPRAVLVERGPGFEVHRVACPAGPDLLVRCEFGNCRAQPALLQANSNGGVVALRGEGN